MKTKRKARQIGETMHDKDGKFWDIENVKKMQF